MRRILLVLAAAAVMVAMIVASATTAIAQSETGLCIAHEAIPEGEEFQGTHGAVPFDEPPAHDLLPVPEAECEEE